MTKTRLSNAQTSHAMAVREAFSNAIGSLRGQWFDDLPRSLGVLPDSYRDELKELPPVYVVHSYATPIAWARRGDKLLTVPDVRYSLTTSLHQELCLRIPGEYEWIDGQLRTIRPSCQIGQRYSNGTPANVFSKGKGRTPFMPRSGY